MAVAVLLTLWARRELPRLYPFLLAITVVMGPAVVYLRAHYLVDVPAGIVVGVLFWRLAPRWQQSLERISVIT
jgi:membrane-associated phospholipid phosphatase